jgi:ubiquinone/menaquinone biosynthesis C-methylase UbiE
MATEIAIEIRHGRILDVGTGPGYLPVEIANLVPGVEVVGVDISRDMVKIARRNAEKAKVSDRVRFRFEDANDMSFEDSLFDFIVSTGALHHWKNPLRVINEVHRVLRRKGQAWIYDFRRDASRKDMQKLREIYGALVGSIVYGVVRVHSGITLQEVYRTLKDTENRFKQYNVEETYPFILKIKLYKGI